MTGYDFAMMNIASIKEMLPFTVMTKEGKIHEIRSVEKMYASNTIHLINGNKQRLDSKEIKCVYNIKGKPPVSKTVQKKIDKLKDKQKEELDAFLTKQKNELEEFKATQQKKVDALYVAGSEKSFIRLVPSIISVDHSGKKALMVPSEDAPTVTIIGVNKIGNRINYLEDETGSYGTCTELFLLR